MDAHEYLLKHSQELSEKYPGKYIAIVGDKMVAMGHDELEVFKEAKEKYQDKEVSIAYLPTDDRNGDVAMRFPYVQFRGKVAPIVPIRLQFNLQMMSLRRWSYFQDGLASDSTSSGERTYLKGLKFALMKRRRLLREEESSFLSNVIKEGVFVERGKVIA